LLLSPGGDARLDGADEAGEELDLLLARVLGREHAQRQPRALAARQPVPAEVLPRLVEHRGEDLRAALIDGREDDGHERDRLSCGRALLGVGADERHAVARRLVVIPDPADRTQIGLSEIADEALEETAILGFEDRLGAGELREHEELEHRQGLRPEILRELHGLPVLLLEGLGQVGEDERAEADVHIVDEGGKFALEFIHDHHPSASGHGAGQSASQGVKSMRCMRTSTMSDGSMPTGSSIALPAAAVIAIRLNTEMMTVRKSAIGCFVVPPATSRAVVTRASSRSSCVALSST